MDNKKIGFTLAGLGLAVLIWAAFIFDTSVPVDAYTRVNNLGLMEDRRNYMTLGGIILAIGLFFLHKAGVFGNSTNTGSSKSINSTKQSYDLAVTDISDSIWTEVANEFASTTRNEGLWAKCLAQNNGDESKAKAAYLSLRANQIAQQNKTTVSKINQQPFQHEVVIEKIKSCVSCERKIGEKDQYCGWCGASQIVKIDKYSNISTASSIHGEHGSKENNIPLTQKNTTEIIKTKSSTRIIFLGISAVMVVFGLIYVSIVQNRKQTSANATPIINNQVNHSVSTSAESPQIKSDQQPTQQTRQYEKIFVSVARNQPSHTSKALISELNGKRVWKYGYIQQNQLSVTNDGEVLIGPFDNEDDAKKVQDSFYNTPYAQDILIVRK